MLGHDLLATLDTVTQLTLILDPKDDLWPPARPARRCVEPPGVGHGLFAVERDRIAALVENFLR